MHSVYLHFLVSEMCTYWRYKFLSKLELLHISNYLFVNGELVMFNEAEALASLDEVEEDIVPKKRPVKKKGKKKQTSRESL